MVYHPGYPGVRMTVVRKFAEMDGFRLLLNQWKTSSNSWQGADNINIIFRAMLDVSCFYFTIKKIAY
jgi:hypothetical protein